MGVVDFDVKGALEEKDAGVIVAEIFIGRIDSKKYRLYERTQLNRLLRERALQATDLVADPEKAIQFGKAARIRYLLIGTVSKLGGNIILGARTIDCETGEIGERATISGASMDQLPDMVDGCLTTMGLSRAPAGRKGAPGYLGLQINDINDFLAKREGYNSAREMGEKLGIGGKAEGVFVATVTEDGPAFKAKMRDRDVIVEYSGKPVRNLADFIARVSATEVGTSVPIKVFRDGKPLTLSVIVAEQPYEVQVQNRASDLLRKGDLDGAIYAYRELTRLKPEDAQAHYSLGSSLRGKMDWDGAILSLREAIRLKPDYPEAHLELGYALSGKGDSDGAIASVREAIRLAPDYAVAHRGLGSLLQSRGDLDGAVSEFKEGVRLAPDDAYAHCELGTALVFKRDWVAAIPALQEAIRLGPNLVDAHFQLGFVFGERNEVDAAISEYAVVLRIQPNHVAAHTNMGSMLCRKGDLDGGAREFSEAIRLLPNYALAHYNLATVYAQKRDARGAVDALRRAIELDSNYRAYAAGNKIFQSISGDHDFKKLIGK